MKTETPFAYQTGIRWLRAQLKEALDSLESHELSHEERVIVGNARHAWRDTYSLVAYPPVEPDARS